MDQTLTAPAACTDAPDGSAPDAALPVRHARRWSDGLRPTDAADPQAPWRMAEQWPQLVATLSEQAVDSSNLVLRALDHLVGAGRLRRAEARALTDALDRLRATSLRAQQITRLAGGRVRLSKDRVGLHEVVQSLLDERAPDCLQRGIALQGRLAPVDVLLDPSAAVGLAGALLDWAVGFSRDVTLQTLPPAGEGPARLVVRVRLPAPQPTGTGAPRARRLHDGLAWMLVRQLVASNELSVRRENADGHAVVTVDFPKAFRGSDGVSSVELLPPIHDGGVGALGALVLVVAAGRQLRGDALAVLEAAGLDAVGVGDLATARRLLTERAVGAVVVAHDLNGPEFARLRNELLAGEQPCPLVEITAGSPSFQSFGFTGFEIPKVGRDALRKELAPTVLFELAKQL